LVRGEYFQTMGIRLLKGRLFTERDDARAPKVVVINDTVAQRFFPNEDPVGKRLTFFGFNGTWSEIVGVVSSIRSNTLAQKPAIEAYAPDLQYPTGSLTFVVRTTAEPSLLTASIRQEVAAIDPLEPLASVSTMEDIVRQSTARPRLLSTLTVLFAALAGLLAA